MKGPRSVFEWKDSETEAIGWVVLDEIINGVAGGGIFMHDNATVQETADIAQNMSKKFTVTDPQIGGAKAGIRFNHRDPRAKDVLRRFINANAQILKNVWVTAGDLNTDDNFIEHVIQKDLGLPTSQATFGRRFSEVSGQLDLSTSLAKLNVFPANDYFPLIEGAVGYGIAATIDEVLKLSKFEQQGKIATVAIQGFGAVGSSLAYYLTNKNIAKVVAIADAFGFIFDQNGLPIEEFLINRHERIRQMRIEGVSETEIETIRKNMFLSDDSKNRFNWTPVSKFQSGSSQMKDYFNAFLECVQADIFSPCAIRYVLTQDSVQRIMKIMKPKFIVSGANNPYGIISNGNLVEDKKGEVLADLERNGIIVVPDWVANSGTAQLFHRGLSIPFNLDTENIANIVLEACADPIRTFIHVANVRFAKGNLIGLARACEKLSLERRKYPKTFKASAGLEQDTTIVGSNPANSRYALPPPQNQLPFDERIKIVRHLIDYYGSECISYEEIEKLMKTCPNPVAYDGFEPSGRMHIAQGLLKTNFVNNMTKCGYTFIFWVADWFAFLNHKMGGDLEKIKNVGRYMIEVWKASGMNMDRVVFLWASEEFSKHGDEYWARVLDISTKNSLKRITRCTQIMGRGDKDLSASQIFYPCMQAADIFFLGVDTCQLGMDQKKVNMLAKEYADDAKLPKPSVLSHPMVPGLKRGQEKMSKSMPDTAIFMEDSEEDVARKIKGAYCPEAVEYSKEIKEKIAKFEETNKVKCDPVNEMAIKNVANPVLSYFRLIVADAVGQIQVNDKSYNNFLELEDDYVNGNIHPVVLKESLTFYVNRLLEPVRNHFKNNQYAFELKEKVLSYSVTR